jgi:hypothetical protein
MREASVITRILQLIAIKDPSAGEHHRFHETRRTEVSHTAVITILECAAPGSPLIPLSEKYTKVNILPYLETAY